MAGQRPPVYAGDGRVAAGRVRLAHPKAGPVWKRYAVRCHPCELVVITADGTPAGRRLGPPRRTANNAWVAAARRLGTQPGEG